MVAVCEKLERSYGLSTGALTFEIQVELPSAVLAADALKDAASQSAVSTAKNMATGVTKDAMKAATPSGVTFSEPAEIASAGLYLLSDLAAGVSAEWYTWLEQARSPSEATSSQGYCR